MNRALIELLRQKVYSEIGVMSFPDPKKVLENESIYIGLERMHRYNMREQKLYYFVPLYYFEKLDFTIFRVYVYQSKLMALFPEGTNVFPRIVGKKGKYTNGLYVGTIDIGISFIRAFEFWKGNVLVVSGEYNYMGVHCHKKFKIKNRKLLSRIEGETQRFNAYRLPELLKFTRLLERYEGPLTIDSHDANIDKVDILYED